MKSKLYNRLYFKILLTILVIVSDQYTKSLVVKIISNTHQKIINLTPFLNIVLTYNKGITFGMLNNLLYGKYILIFITIIITLILCYSFIKSENSMEQYALSLIIGGALGNIIDRLRLGGVIDFIDFYIYTYHWYSFNIADSAICLGVLMLLILQKRNNKYRGIKL